MQVTALSRPKVYLNNENVFLLYYACHCKSFACQVSTNPGSAGQWLDACCVSSIVMYLYVINNYTCVCIIVAIEN